MGTTNINTRASDYGKGGRLTVSSSDRSYNHRILASYGTGQMKRGWSAAIALGNRWGVSGYTDGTFYDAQSLFATAEKEWHSHSVNATLIAAPNRRGKSSPNTQEVYDFKGFAYNEYWGIQSGKVRNSRVRRIVEPILMLNHKWTVSPKTTLRTNLGFQFGEVGNSRLDYPGGANPSPSYYQKLPSYFLTKSRGADYEGAYRHEQDFRQNGQLDWNRLYDANLNTKTAAYALYEDRNDDTQLTVNTLLRSELNNNITLTGVVQYRSFSSENFAEILDLLGASGYLNVDAYDGTQFNLNAPNRISEVGDKIRYHYSVDAAIHEASAIARFNYPKISGYAAAGYAATQYQRDGKYKHEAYPDSSFGKSKILSFRGGSLKAGFTYNIKNRHWVQANAALIQRAPSLRNTFSNARETNVVVGEQANRPLQTERISAADMSYIFRSPYLNVRLTGFYTRIEGANEISFFFAEGIGGDTSSFVQEIMQGIAKCHQGVEFGIEGKITPSLKLKGAAALGDYRYANNPNVYLTSNDFGYLDFGTAKMKNLRLASGPQEAYSLGVEFRENFWWFGLTANYFDHNYLNVSPINRTQNFLIDRDGLPFPNYDSNQARILLRQEKFEPYAVVNMVVGKSWRVGNRFVGAFLSVNNVLNQTYKTGGFEQSRNANYNTLLEDVSGSKRRFGPKYWFGRGTTYFLNTYIRF